MTELKTLKDLYTISEHEWGEGKHMDECEACTENDVVKNIRQEAIKWVKHFGKTSEDFIITGGMNCTTFIKHFFNITDEDLK